MDNAEMIRCLDAVADYMEHREESPLCAKDLRRIKNTIENIQADNTILTIRNMHLEDSINKLQSELGKYKKKMIKFIKGFIIGLLLMVLPIIIKTLIILDE